MSTVSVAATRAGEQKQYISWTLSKCGQQNPIINGSTCQ